MIALKKKTENRKQVCRRTETNSVQPSGLFFVSDPMQRDMTIEICGRPGGRCRGGEVGRNQSKEEYASAQTKGVPTEKAAATRV